MSNPLPLLFARLEKDPTCVSFQDLANALDFVDVSPEEVIKRINELTEVQSLISNTLAKYYAKASVRLIEGHEVPNMKLKVGAKKRTINNEGLAVNALKHQGIPTSDLYVSKLIGLPAMEKLLSAKGLSKDQIESILEDFIDVDHAESKAVIA